jgi:glycosyltransferase involved in cell wall biosynthesis
MAPTPVPPEAALPQPQPGAGGTREVLAGLSVVVPCREAESGVGPAIRTLAAGAAATSADYEIVVVDDGSSDGTARSVARFVDPSGRVRLLVHPHPRGYGAAVRTGLGAARMPWVLLASATDGLDTSDLQGLAALTPSADVVAGWRTHRTDPFSRRVAGAAWNRLMRALFALPMHDVDCAFKLIRGDVLHRIELHAGGPVIAAELLVRCRAEGASVAEYPLGHRPLELGPQPRIRVGATVRALGETARRQAELRRLSRGVPSARTGGV